MSAATRTITSETDGLGLHLNIWTPDSAPKGVVQISHGLAEHSARYGRFAEALNAAGYAVYANDHRGHGKSLNAGGFGEAGEAGWPGLLADIVQINQLIRERLVMLLQVAITVRLMMN